jgi:hypothetical protein
MRRILSSVRADEMIRHLVDEDLVSSLDIPARNCFALSINSAWLNAEVTVEGVAGSKHSIPCPFPDNCGKGKKVQIRSFLELQNDVIPLLP